VLRLVSHYRGLLKKSVSIQVVNECKWMSLPKVILLDRANSVNRSHIGLDAENFQTQAGSFFNHLVCMIGVLWRYGVRFPLYITRNVLLG